MALLEEALRVHVLDEDVLDAEDRLEGRGDPAVLVVGPLVALVVGVEDEDPLARGLHPPPPKGRLRPVRGGPGGRGERAELHRGRPAERLAGPPGPGAAGRTILHEFPRYFYLVPARLRSQTPGIASRSGEVAMFDTFRSARRGRQRGGPPGRWRRRGPPVRRGAAPARRRRGHARAAGRCGRRVRSCRAPLASGSPRVIPGLTFDVTREAAAESRVGVSEMEWGLADTGTRRPGRDRSRATARLDAARDPRRAPSRRAGSSRASPTSCRSSTRDASPYISFITGPSRTADIERVLTIGVHGPSRLVVVVHDGDGATRT